jgi:hypothetical protein
MQALTVSAADTNLTLALRAPKKQNGDFLSPAGPTFASSSKSVDDANHDALPMVYLFFPYGTSGCVHPEDK